jgi:hypothetical protein
MDLVISVHRLSCFKEKTMKKALFVLTLAIVTAGSLFAGGVHDTITVEGRLAVTDAIPSIVADGKTWILPAGPFYQLAWENGVKIGDSIKAEGFEFVPGDRRGPVDRADGKNMMAPSADKAAPAPAPADKTPSDAKSAPATSADVKLFMPTRVWVNGKEIDLSTVRTGNRFGPEMGERGDGAGGCPDRWGESHNRGHGRK